MGEDDTPTWPVFIIGKLGFAKPHITKVLGFNHLFWRFWWRDDDGFWNADADTIKTRIREYMGDLD